MDTAVYRGGDMASGWIFTWLQQYAGLALAGISFVAVPLAVLWAWIGLWLARCHRMLTAQHAELDATRTAPTPQEKTA